VRKSFTARGLARHALAELVSFLVIGAGAVGCVAAGIAADRFGRTSVTSWAMAVSGGCCLAIGFFFGGSPWLLLAAAAVWGRRDHRRLSAVLRRRTAVAGDRPRIRPQN
jgi:MFS family permease